MSDASPKNRIPNRHLSYNEVQIISPNGVLDTDFNGVLVEVLGRRALDDQTGFTHLCCDAGSHCEGVFVYRTHQITLNLSLYALKQLLCRNLSPMRYFMLRARFGVFHEIEDDFYDPESGIAMQPLETD